jgi:NAD-dependent dihydropyrimidine dehydrogenase PreA subunit
MPLSIDLEKCSACKTCYTSCPQDVFGWDQDKKEPQVSYPYECSHCGICWMECPERAIDITLPVSFY